jgi:hypothetical protein
MSECMYCEYCGNEIDLDNTHIHSTCREWYVFLLDSMIEELKLKLIVLIKKRLQVNNIYC